MNVRKTVTTWFPKASNRLVVAGDQEIMNGNRNCRDSYYGVETDRSHTHPHLAFPAPCAQRRGHSTQVNACIFAIERAKWRHCCNRQSRVVVRPLPVAGLADLAESDTQLSVFRALPANRRG